METESNARPEQRAATAILFTALFPFEMIACVLVSWGEEVLTGGLPATGFPTVEYLVWLAVVCVVGAAPVVLIARRRRLLTWTSVSLIWALSLGILTNTSLFPLLPALGLMLIYPGGVAIGAAIGGRRGRVMRSYAAGLIGCAVAAIVIILCSPFYQKSPLAFVIGTLSLCFWLTVAIAVGFSDETVRMMERWLERLPSVLQHSAREQAQANARRLVLKAWISATQRVTPHSDFVESCFMAFLMLTAVLSGRTALSIATAAYFDSSGLREMVRLFFARDEGSLLVCVSAAIAVLPFARLSFCLLLLQVFAWHILHQAMGLRAPDNWTNASAVVTAGIVVWQFLSGLHSRYMLKESQPNPPDSGTDTWLKAYESTASSVLKTWKPPRGHYDGYRRDTRLLFWYWMPPSFVFGWTWLALMTLGGTYVWAQTESGLLIVLQLVWTVGFFLLQSTVEAPAYLAQRRTHEAVRIMLFRPFRSDGKKHSRSVLVPTLGRCGRLWTAFGGDYTGYEYDDSVAFAYEDSLRFRAEGQLFPPGNNAWKRAVELMQEVSDVAVIDLSTASPNLAWELDLARSRYPASRIIFLVERRLKLKQLAQYYELPGGSKAVYGVLLRFIGMRFWWIPLALSLRRTVLRSLATAPSVPAAAQLQALARHMDVRSEERDGMQRFLDKVAPNFRLGGDIAAWYCRRAVESSSLVALQRLGLNLSGDEGIWEHLSIQDRYRALLERMQLHVDN